MSTWHLLAAAWDWEPTVVGGCAGLLAAYAAVSHAPMHGQATFTKPPSGAATVEDACGALGSGSPGGASSFEAAPSGSAGGWRAASFVLGVLVLLFALVSPLDVLGDGYLFSAHMAQHLLLIEVVPPLLLLGLPPGAVARLLAWPPADRLERTLGRPAPAWLLGTGVLWAWHAPALYNAALASEGIHVVQHLSFLVAATVFWWPVLAPLSARRLPAWAAVGYLFAGAFANSVLGIVLTFSPPGLYPAYLRPADPLGILPLLRDGWGLTPAADQRLGGGLMWMIGGLVYLLAIALVVARWYSAADEAADEAAKGEAAAAPPAAEGLRAAG